MSDIDVHNFMNRLTQIVAGKYCSAKLSGALSGEESEVSVVKAVAKIAVLDLQDKNSNEVYNNLKYFV